MTAKYLKKSLKKDLMNGRLYGLAGCRNHLEFVRFSKLK